MAGDLAQFQFPETGQPIRTLNRDGEPWFVARDVAEALDLRDHRTSVALLDEDERHSMPVADALGRLQDTILINEPGLYSFILRSRKAEARAFKRWITHEVLPAIRKTGRYETELLGDELAELERATERTQRAIALAKAERAAREAAVNVLGIAAPKADAWDAMASAEGDFAVRVAASILNRDTNISTGQQRLFKKLRELGMIDGRDRPFSNHSHHVVSRLVPFVDRWGISRVDHQPRVTVEGLRYLHKKMGGKLPFSALFEQLSTEAEQLAIPAQRPVADALFELETSS